MELFGSTLHVWRMVVLFFVMAVVPFRIPTHGAQAAGFSASHQQLWFPVCIFFKGKQPDGYEKISHCGLDLHFLMISDTEHLFTCLLTIFASSLEKCLLQRWFLMSQTITVFPSQFVVLPLIGKPIFLHTSLAHSSSLRRGLSEHYLGWELLKLI